MIEDVVIMIWLVVSLIGIAVLSVVIAIVLVHFYLRGLEALASHMRPLRYKVWNGNEYARQQNKKETAINDISIPKYEASCYGLYDIIRNYIHKASKQQIGKYCPEKQNQTTKQKPLHYTKGCLPRTTPFSLPLPIKHIGNIVNKLRRHVNQSGKEPRELFAF
jgi:hypothetical protein